MPPRVFAQHSSVSHKIGFSNSLLFDTDSVIFGLAVHAIVKAFVTDAGEHHDLTRKSKVGSIGRARNLSAFPITP